MFHLFGPELGLIDLQLCCGFVLGLECAFDKAPDGLVLALLRLFELPARLLVLLVAEGLQLGLHLLLRERLLALLHAADVL